MNNYDENFYDTTVSCTCCHKDYKATKVRPNKSKVKGSDTDFMPIYEGINKLMYEVLVCPHCGYAYHKSMERTYSPFIDTVKSDYIDKLQKIINLCGERTLDQAITSYKMAYYVGKLAGEKNIILANYPLKIAWLYRTKADVERENQYLRVAKNLFEQSFASSQEGDDKLRYLLANISIRLNEEKDAKSHLSKLLTDKEVSDKYRQLAKKIWEDYKTELEKTSRQEL